MEHQRLERKSLKLITSPKQDWESLARECVCFANSHGGTLLVGVENDGSVPPDQRIPDSLPERVFKRIAELTMNVTLASPVVEHNVRGGQFIRLKVLPSHSLACTTDGRYFARLSDYCKPVPPEGMMRLAAEKGAFVWELIETSIPVQEADEGKMRRLLANLRVSDRIKASVKQRPDAELLAHYDLCRDGMMTNLGVLWIGRREQRAALSHSPIVQFIRYDEGGTKISKELWGDDYALNPREILEALTRLDVWQEGVEIPDGLFRARIPSYDVEAIRELVANALVHRMYTIRGDIFINLFSDRLEVHSPGPLPPSVTPQNILHVSERRNERLARLFHDLGLMEGEGTGYDRLYDLLLSTGRPVPEVEETSERVKVTIRGRSLDLQALRVVAAAESSVALRERERIALGLIARYGPLTAAALASRLALRNTAEVHQWIERLLDLRFVQRRGKGSGTRYRVNAALLKASGYRTRTSLVTIEDYRLRELIGTDVEHYPESAISDIIERVGREIPRSRYRRLLAVLVREGELVLRGERRGARYSVAESVR